MASSARTIPVALLLVALISTTCFCSTGVLGHQVRIENHCPHTVWVGILGGNPVPADGGFVLSSNDQRTLAFANHWSGRIWGRTGCNDGGRNCETGECGGDGIHCRGTGGRPPATLAEITFDSGIGGLDFYDVSLVDGYNLPMSMEPLAGTYHRRSGDQYDCGNAGCDQDLNPTCPNDLRKYGRDGRVVGCDSACNRYNTDRFCCRGAFGTPATCPPFSQSQAFKAACPRAYSYAYDDQTSTYTCAGNGVGASGYVVKFCTGGPSPPLPPCTQWGWRFYDHYDIVGHDMYRVWAGNRNDCQPLCRSAPGCQGYSWFQNFCYLKNGAGEIRRADQVYSAVLCASSNSLPITSAEEENLQITTVLA